MLPPRQRTGSVLVNGTLRTVCVTGSPSGHMKVQVDGIAMYDKRQIIQHKAIDFDVIPGKKAKLRWHQNAQFQHEYEVIVDGQSTKLALVPEAPAVAQQRKKFAQIIRIVVTFSAAIGFYWFNYHSLTTVGTYYPKSLALIPFTVFAGLAEVLYLRFHFSAKNIPLRVVVGIIGLGTVVFGFTFFTAWFLATYSKP
jgi:hypothetical protein